ncbi:MAG: hypothetical protein AAF211_25940, partial [Myxococcota bacterium]
IQAKADGAPLIRDDKVNQNSNVIFDWEVGDREGTDRAFAEADMTALLTAIKQRYPASDTMIVLPAPGVVYRDVVRVLDVARETEREDGEKVPLFPVVVMSRKVQG